MTIRGRGSLCAENSMPLFLVSFFFFLGHVSLLSYFSYLREFSDLWSFWSGGQCYVLRADSECRTGVLFGKSDHVHTSSPERTVTSHRLSSTSVKNLCLKWGWNVVRRNWGDVTENKRVLRCTWTCVFVCCGACWENSEFYGFHTLKGFLWRWVISFPHP